MLFTNRDVADVALTVSPFPIDAVNDAGAAPRTGGTALASVLANDRYAGVVALDYRICEIATPSNCDQAVVTATVQPC